MSNYLFPKLALAVVSLLFSACATAGTQGKTAGDSGLDISTAYRMATAADCTYHMDGRMSEESDPLTCLKTIPDFAGLKQGDVLSWTAPDHECGRDKAVDGYLLIRTKDEVIIAIRGTQPPIPDMKADKSVFSDWVNDFDAVPDGSGFHPGFLKSWECVHRDLLTEKAKAFLGPDNIGNRKIMVTGHSKGGAVVVLAAAKLCNVEDKLCNEEAWPYKKPEAFYAFEAARPMTAIKASAYKGKLVNLVRLSNKADIVPLVPPGALYERWKKENPVLFKILPEAVHKIPYDSDGLGTLFYINGHNELKKMGEQEALNEQLKEIDAAYKQEALDKFFISRTELLEGMPMIMPLLKKGVAGVWESLKKKDIPYCHVVENNHTAHLEYLRLALTNQVPVGDAPIHSSWDKYCSAGYIKESIIKDVQDRFRK